MPGTITVKPIEANLKKNHDFLKKQDPYCTVYLGSQKVKGEVCRLGGKHPHWKDSITVARSAESTMMIEIKDKDLFTEDDLIGVCQVDLADLDSKTALSRWYPVYNNKHLAGEILIDLNYTPFQTEGTTGKMQQLPTYGPSRTEQPNVPQQGGPTGKLQQFPTFGPNQTEQPIVPQQGGTMGQPGQGPVMGGNQQGYLSGGQYGGMQPTQFPQGPNAGAMQSPYGQGQGLNPQVAPPQFSAPNMQQNYGPGSNYTQPHYPQGGMMQGQGPYNQ